MVSGPDVSPFCSSETERTVLTFVQAEKATPALSLATPLLNCPQRRCPLSSNIGDMLSKIMSSSSQNGTNSCYLSPTASRGVGTKYPDAAGYSATPCNATYWGATSCLLTTTVAVVAIEAAEKMFQVVFQMALYICGSIRSNRNWSLLVIHKTLTG
jgi:hypothetical protein